MQAIDILHHDCSPNYFWDELCGSVAIFTNPQIFSYPERSTRSHVDEPKCNGQFLTMVKQMKYLFFFNIMQNKFHTRYVGPTSCMSPDNLCSSAHEFQSSGGGFYPLQQRNVCTWADYSLQSRFDPAVSSHLFPSLPFNILTEMPVASSSRDVWQQHITSSILRLHFKNLLSNAFCHLHITMNFASTEQRHSCSHIQFTGHCHDHILWLLQMASIAKKVNHTGVMFQFCRNQQSVSIEA
jgi:hypothetical protein